MISMGKIRVVLVIGLMLSLVLTSVSVSSNNFYERI